MDDDPNDEAIINAVVNLGKNLGINVVAEGIERMSQAERLLEIGCDYGQGVLFSEALPGNRIARSRSPTSPAGARRAPRAKLAASRDRTTRGEALRGHQSMWRRPTLR